MKDERNNMNNEPIDATYLVNSVTDWEWQDGESQEEE